MSLQTTIADITVRLRQRKFPNEQSISLGIVAPILSELGWNIRDPDVVCLEYGAGKGRVDYALCHPPRVPLIFIEVKQPGKAENAEVQAFNYAFHAGVQFVVLTDGRTWSFYLPGEQGSYENRRVGKLDICEHTAAKARAVLQCYLLRSRVVSREAFEHARKEYQIHYARSFAKTIIPDAWHELVENGNEQLAEILTNAVATKAGVRPDADDVAAFLRNLKEPSSKPQTSPGRNSPLHSSTATQSPSVRHTKTNLPVRNGVHQPKEGTLTRTIWDTADKLTAKNGKPAMRREVVEALPTVKFSTLHTQYFRWRNYNGIKGRLC